MGTDSGLESRMTAWGQGRLEGGRIEQKGKRTHGQQGGDCWEEVDIRGLNGNGKNTRRLILKKEKERPRPLILG